MSSSLPPSTTDAIKSFFASWTSNPGWSDGSGASVVRTTLENITKAAHAWTEAAYKVGQAADAVYDAARKVEGHYTRHDEPGVPLP